MAISCGTQAALACTCDLGRQLEGKCREVKQLHIAEAAHSVHLHSRDATISRLKSQLQAASNKYVF